MARQHHHFSEIAQIREELTKIESLFLSVETVLKTVPDTEGTTAGMAWMQLMSANHHLSRLEDLALNSISAAKKEVSKADRIKSRAKKAKSAPKSRK